MRLMIVSSSTPQSPNVESMTYYEHSFDDNSHVPSLTIIHESPKCHQPDIFRTAADPCRYQAPEGLDSRVSGHAIDVHHFLAVNIFDSQGFVSVVISRHGFNS